MVSVIANIETGHEDLIHDAQMDYYGNRLATCSTDRSVKIYEVKGSEQTQVADLREHEGPVWQVAWAHPMYGNLLASCSYDRKVIIWQENAPHWTKLYEHNVHNSSVNSICWAPHEHGLILACASSDGSVSILTYKESWVVKKINNAHNVGCNAVYWAPAIPSGSADGSVHGGAPVQRLVTGGCDYYVKIWRFEATKDKEEWILEDKLEGHSDWVRDVAWAPSIGLPRSIIASCSQDRRVIIWIKEEVSGKWQQRDLGVFDDVVWNVSWSITGNILAVSGGDNKVTLWKETMEGQWICLSDSSKGQSVSDQR